jgi:hypothetical protein
MSENELARDKTGSMTNPFKEFVQSMRKGLSYILVHENFACNVYKSRLIPRNEADFRPKIDNFTLKIMTSRKQYEDLLTAGFDISCPNVARTGDRLDKGAVACAIFIGKELASIEWVATDAAAKASLDTYPCKIDFANREAYAGAVWSNPKYRGKGIHMYVYYKIYDFLRERGAASVVSIVEVNNTAAIRAHNRFAPEEKVEARGRYLRLLGLQFWRERPL